MTQLTKSLIASLLLMPLASLHAAEQMLASVGFDFYWRLLRGLKA
jgi:hypothetical protein